MVCTPMKVLYIGDDKLKSDQFFAGAEDIQVFQRRIKDYEPLLEALKDSSGIEVEHKGGPEIIETFPVNRGTDGARCTHR